MMVDAEGRKQYDITRQSSTTESTPRVLGRHHDVFGEDDTDEENFTVHFEEEPLAAGPPAAAKRGPPLVALPMFLSWYVMWFCIVSNWSFIQSKAHKQLAAAWLFVYGVLMISMEDWLRLDKSIIAVVMAAVLWTVRAYDIGETENKLLDDLVEQLGEMAEVVFFLLSAMSIVETIELHEGFFWVEQWLRRTNGSENITWRLPVALSGITFCLSAVLDNLTATIVMMKLLRALLPNSQVDRHICGSIVVVAANAGGAWSPVGDVTTTMLWIAGDISTSGIVAATIIPSLICWLVPLGGLTATWLMGSGPRRLGDSPTGRTKEASDADSPKYPRLLFAGGMLALLMVPILKTFAHIPPYMGMLFVMTTLWGCVEFLEVPSRTVADGMRRVDIPGVMYFVGMILSVGALMVLDVLRRVAASLESAFPGVADPERLGPVICVTSLLGMISAVVDNVPLVRAIIEMFPDVERDASLWHLTALTAGTGGSILVIGSVAGVAFMNMEHVGFWWYVKRVSPWVLLGYGCGIAAYAVQRLLLRH